ncbi:MAG: caspase family protein [Ilumatobacteraceae bacterium]
MDRRVFCLLVGIDAYGPPINVPLQGCLNDMHHLEQYLRGRLGEAASIVTLTDGQATKEGVVTGFRTHLAQAGKGDIVLFAYSGHGSQEVPPTEFAFGDASGKLQNLLLSDAGQQAGDHFVWPLADKELGLLLDEVVERGAHVVAMLDCCHSGDGTRDAFVTVRQWNPANARDADPAVQTAIDKLKGPRPLDGFLDGTLTHFEKRPSTGHVALTACQSSELAKELMVGDEHRGAFTATMIEVLETVGSKADYRSVVAAVRSRLERTVERQRPSVYPIDAGGLGDGLFLDGTIEPAAPSFLMTKSESGWSVDAGSVHGLRAPVDGEEFRFACFQPDGAASGQVRVVAVETGRADVEPMGWEPADIAYRAVISWVPLPVATVTFDPTDGEPAATAYEQVRQKLASSGPSGTPSPYVRERVAGSSPAGLALRVRFEDDQPAGPCLRVLRADGSPAIPTAASTVACGDPARAAATLVQQLEHVSRWEQLRDLGSQRSALADAVQLRIYPATKAEMALPADRQPYGLAGEYTIPYEANGDSPHVFMHLKNTSDRDLYVALLDLTDRLECTVSYQTTKLVAGQEDNVNPKGGPMNLSLSQGVDPVPGARTQDWLKIIVSENEFGANAFKLDAIGEQSRSVGAAPSNMLELIAARTVSRSIAAVDPGKFESAGADWCATTVALVVEVPTVA